MIRSAQSTVNQIEPGQSIYVAGGLTPPAAWVETLQQDPERTRGLRITTTLVPGFANPFDFDRLHANVVVAGPMMRPDLTEAQRQGRFRALPVTFSGFLRHLETQTFDIGVVQVAPPDAQGRYSLGPSVEFSPPALRRCRRIIAVINPLLPAMPSGISLERSQIDMACEAASALPHEATHTDTVTDTIGRHIAEFLEDGITLQTGLGKVPMALARSLRGHRRIRIHSGMVSDGLMELARAGALDEEHRHHFALATGSEALHAWLPQAQGLRLTGCDETHAPATLAGLCRFVSINSALEVDLFGQCNQEHLNGRAISGAGGAPDFARTARNSPGGLSVVALNATYAKGTRSRIVAALGSGAVASLSRLDVDLVVTEFGVADLRQASVYQRAQALIRIAAPPFRDALEQAWRERLQAL